MTTIERLRTLLAEATPGPWAVMDGWGTNIVPEARRHLLLGGAYRTSPLGTVGIGKERIGTVGPVASDEETTEFQRKVAAVGGVKP